MQPQRLIVPLFQRPYVWNKENQWEPLWEDVLRVTNRLLGKSQERQQPHFLGAVVLQQVQRPTGLMQQRTIIDGQQRLTTLQLLLDALHAELLRAEALQPAMRIEPLVVNAAPFCSKPEDRFKVWPTNRDRPAFNAVMASTPSDDNSAVAFQGERMVEAHSFFRDQARQWLSQEGAADITARAVAIETAVRDFLQIVVIDLAADENAQEIFETLNARGAQLTAADLIKNFVFQRLLESKTDVEIAYQSYWKEFETGFWETEISVGRIKYPRSSIFLNHWLIARTGEEVVAREVFARFKTFADFDARLSMNQLLEQIHSAAGVYRQFVAKSLSTVGAIDRLGLFGYRTGVLESEVIKPFVLHLLDPEESKIPEAQFVKALDVVESWMVRRMLVRATTKNYNQVVSELVALIRKSDRTKVGDTVESYLASQSSGSRYWPDDLELREELEGLLAYRRLGRGRLRMVLEAIEDYQRGWQGEQVGLGGERVARGGYAIEHVMPRKWAMHWPLQDKGITEADRDRLIHTLGNLTLLTGRLNSKVSNGPWLGQYGKREGLEGHDVLLLNRDLLRTAGDQWTDDAIRQRTEDLIQLIVQIWHIPQNHRSGFSAGRASLPRRKVRLSDLIGAGALQVGAPLYPRRKKFADRVATLLPDGQIGLDDQLFSSPSDAAKTITGGAGSVNGWWFFLVDQASKRSLRDVRREYVNAMSMDSEDDEGDDEGEEDEGQ